MFAILFHWLQMSAVWLLLHTSSSLSEEKRPYSVLCNHCDLLSGGSCHLETGILKGALKDTSRWTFIFMYTLEADVAEQNVPAKLNAIWVVSLWNIPFWGEHWHSSYRWFWGSSVELRKCGSWKALDLAAKPPYLLKILLTSMLDQNKLIVN